MGVVLLDFPPHANLNASHPDPLHRQQLPQPHGRGHPARRGGRDGGGGQRRIRPGWYVHPLAIEVLKEIDIDISGHTSKHLDEFLAQDVHTTITVCGNADQACPVFPGQAVKYHWPFDDPAHATGTEAEQLAVFRRVRDEIRAKFEAYADTLR